MPELKPEHLVSENLKKPTPVCVRHFWDEVIDGKRQCMSCGVFKDEEKKDGE